MKVISSAQRYDTGPIRNRELTPRQTAARDEDIFPGAQYREPKTVGQTMRQKLLGCEFAQCGGINDRFLHFSFDSL